MSAQLKFPSPPSWASELTTVGVTGTNGKTSTTWLVAAAMGTTHVAQTTTVGSFVGDEQLTVPRDLRGFLATMREARDRGGRYAAIELTSEAMALGFMRAWPCAVGAFTNLTRDHLDAHGSAEHYLASKAQLFMQLPANGCAVLNACDPASALLAEIVPAGVRVLRYGVPSRGAAEGALDLRATKVVADWQGTSIELDGIAPLRIRCIGDVFAENALAALGAAMGAGIAPEIAAEGLSRRGPPPGRFEVLGSGPRVVIDYAHTPDALARTLATAKQLTEGEVVVVFGAGGERDAAKRPMMGEAAFGADRVVLTSDNPRSEDPAAIAAAIAVGLRDHDAVETELDRASAIRGAIAGATLADTLLIAGKGHEVTQCIDGETRAFSDREIAQHALAARG